MATALKYVASVSLESGVSLEEMVSWIGTISSTTRIGSESIGQALKTLLVRMQDIKANKIDEDGIGINNVETALARIDVKLRDSKNSFRDMSDVLKDVAAKWNTLSETEQANKK